MSITKKQVLKYSLSLVAAAILLYFSFKGVNWSEFVGCLEGCRWGFVLLSMFCGVLAFAFRALRWRQMLRPIDSATSLRTTYEAVTVGNVSNFIFQYLGEITRCAIVCRHSKPNEKGERLRFDQAIGTIAVERVFDLLSIAVLFFLLLLCKWDTFGDFFRTKLWEPAVAASSNSLVVIALVVILLLVVLFCFLVFRFRGRNKAFAFAAKVIAGLYDGVKACFRLKGKCFFVLMTAAIWLMYMMQIVMIGYAVPSLVSFNFSDALFIMLAGSMASFVPVPGGMGAYHYLIALALTGLYGLNWASAIVFATLAHESQALAMVVTGGISFFSEMSRD